jgi:DNA-binding HxlR family transcriptional regulator
MSRRRSGSWAAGKLVIVFQLFIKADATLTWRLITGSQMLAQRLRQLEDDGIVARTIYSRCRRRSNIG